VRGWILVYVWRLVVDAADPTLIYAFAALGLGRAHGRGRPAAGTPDVADGRAVTGLRQPLTPRPTPDEKSRGPRRGR
jgi:hypothetical protein